jgi:hypothetical protein
MVEMNSIWDSWNNAYHGTSPQNTISIIRHQTLLGVGDTTQDGMILAKNASVFEVKQIYFLSPNINYASHPWYSRIVEFKKDPIT